MSKDKILMSNQCPNELMTKIGCSSFLGHACLARSHYFSPALIPSESLEINVKLYVEALEKTPECVREDGLPGQASSSLVKPLLEKAASEC